MKVRAYALVVPVLLAGLGLAVSACALGAAMAGSAGPGAGTVQQLETHLAAPTAAATIVPTTMPPPPPLPASSPPVTDTTTTPTPRTTDATAPRRITVAVAGDVLTNKNVLRSLAGTSPEAYDFGPIFAPIAPYLEAADFAVVNLETRLGGPERGYSSFPRFNTPDSLATALKEAGVDLTANANNHALDMGWEGLARSVEVVRAAGLGCIGTYRSQEERDTPYVVDVGGIDLGFLSYTTITNGIPLPKGRPYALALLDPAVVAVDAARAREAGADLVIAIIHWGVEYERRPSRGLRALSETLLRECGVDAIVAGHPHVVQSIERVVVPASPTGGRYVVYSLGNFMSGMSTRYSDGGMVIYLQIEKRDGVAWVDGIRYLPVYMQRGISGGRMNYRVLPALPGLTPESDLPLTARDRAKLGELWRDTSGLVDAPGIGVWALDHSVLGLD